MRNDGLSDRRLLQAESLQNRRDEQRSVALPDVCSDNCEAALHVERLLGDECQSMCDIKDLSPGPTPVPNSEGLRKSLIDSVVQRSGQGCIQKS